MDAIIINRKVRVNLLLDDLERILRLVINGGKGIRIYIYIYRCVEVSYEMREMWLNRALDS